MLVLSFLCVKRTQIYHVNQLQSFQLVQSSFFYVKMVNHYGVHLIFQDIEHQIPKNILHHFIYYSFYENFIKLRSIFYPLKIIYWKLLQQRSYLHPNIEDTVIPYFYYSF